MRHLPESKFVKRDQQEISPRQANLIKALQGPYRSERSFKKIATFSQTLREVSQRSSHSFAASLSGVVREEQAFLQGRRQVWRWR